MFLDDIERAFCDELHKIGASNMHVPQTRVGRRSISVDNLLKKDKEGKLFKHAPKIEKTAMTLSELTMLTGALGGGVLGATVAPPGRRVLGGLAGAVAGGAIGQRQPLIGFGKTAGSGAGNAGTSINMSPAISYSPEYTAGPLTGAEARPKRKKGEPPSREDVETHHVQDGRGNATVIPGTGTQWSDIGAANPSL